MTVAFAITFIPRLSHMGLFSEVPKLFGPTSGVTFPFIPSQSRGSMLSNFAIFLVFFFFYIKNALKDQLSKTSDCSFDFGYSVPKRSRDFRQTGLSPQLFKERIATDHWMNHSGANFCAGSIKPSPCFSRLHLPESNLAWREYLAWTVWTSCPSKQ